MARISKIPEERRAELVDTAERLFFTNGYEQTAVSDIVKALGVAQGTFYYYFNSKQHILEAVIDKLSAEIEKVVVGIFQDESKDAIRKFKELIDAFLTFRIRRMNTQIVEYLHGEESAALHQKIARHLACTLTPHISRLISNGLSSGLFSVTDIEETVEFLIGGVFYLMDSLKPDDPQERIERAVRITLRSSFRVLGVEKDEA